MSVVRTLGPIHVFREPPDPGGKNSFHRTIDLSFLICLYSCHPTHRGASSGDRPKAGREAAPAGGACNPTPGRPRPAVRPHYEGLPSMAGRGGRRRAAGAVRAGRPQAFRSPARKHGLRGQKSPQRSAERRACRSQGARRRKAETRCAARRSVPLVRRSPQGEGGSPGGFAGTTACPGPQRIRAMSHACAKRACPPRDALAKGCLTTESGSDDCATHAVSSSRRRAHCCRKIESPACISLCSPPATC